MDEDYNPDLDGIMDDPFDDQFDEETPFGEQLDGGNDPFEETAEPIEYEGCVGEEYDGF